MSTNYPRYRLFRMETIADLQGLISDALSSDSDQTARAVDALLADKDDGYRATAVAFTYAVLRPYEG